MRLFVDIRKLVNAMMDTAFEILVKEAYSTFKSTPLVVIILMG
jgi:hypothetical protein